MDQAYFKCRKCRQLLFTSEKVIDTHGTPVTNQSLNSVVCTEMASENLWYLRDDNLEKWMEQQLNQGDWIKGKVFCPKCNGRLGSYDFVSGLKCPCGISELPPIHIVRSRVDCEQKTEMEDIKKKIHAAENVYQRVCFDLGKQVKETPQCSTEEENGLVGFSLSSKEMREHHAKQNKAKLLVGKRPLNEELSQENTSEFSFKEIMQKSESTEYSNSSVPSSEDLNDTSGLVCPVCLDVFFSPFTCQPCGHIFCETCLRKVAKPNPTKTFCPLCRQLIGCCEVNRDISFKVKQYFPVEYKTRLLTEERYVFQSSPLPWTPHYRFRHLTMFGKKLFSTEESNRIRNMLTSLSLSLPTIGILILLNVTSIIMFLLSYFGFSYIPVFIARLSSIVWHALTSQVYPRDKGLEGLHGAISNCLLLLAFTVALTVVTCRRMKLLAYHN